MACPICGDKISKCPHTWDEIENAKQAAQPCVEELEEVQAENKRLMFEIAALKTKYLEMNGEITAWLDEQESFFPPEPTIQEHADNIARRGLVVGDFSIPPQRRLLRAIREIVSKHAEEGESNGEQRHNGNS